MTPERVAYVHMAELQLGHETDSAAVGAAVTTALCGHWEHAGPCHWPHNNHIDVAGSAATFRTLFVAPAGDEIHVRGLIERSLRNGEGWVVEQMRSRPLTAAEAPLARRLAAIPPG